MRRWRGSLRISRDGEVRQVEVAVVAADADAAGRADRRPAVHGVELGPPVDAQPEPHPVARLSDVDLDALPGTRSVRRGRARGERGVGAAVARPARRLALDGELSVAAAYRHRVEVLLALVAQEHVHAVVVAGRRAGG